MNKFYNWVRSRSDEELEQLFLKAMDHGANNFDSYLAPNNTVDICFEEEAEKLNDI